jgi:hypothetical protein
MMGETQNTYRMLLEISPGKCHVEDLVADDVGYVARLQSGV